MVKKQNFLAENVKNEGGNRQKELSAVFFSFDKFREELFQQRKSFENSKQFSRNGVQKQSKGISMSLLRFVLHFGTNCTKPLCDFVVKNEQSLRACG